VLAATADMLRELGACPDSVRRYVDMESIAGSGLRIRVV
jgi:hypothetical protein